MKIRIFTTALVLGLSTLGWSEDRLPLDTQILLKKLIDWEAGEKASLDKRYQAKASEVAVALKAHLKRATQAGDLKTANLIQAKIDELSKPSVVATAPDTVDPKNSPSFTNDQLEKILINSTWEIYRDDGYIIEYHFGQIGEGKRIDKNKIHEFSLRWKIDDGVPMYYSVPDKKWQTITISSNGKEMSTENPNEGKLRYRKK